MPEGGHPELALDRVEGLVEALRAGRPVEDAAFDSLLPPAIEARSVRHFSSIDASMRAARWLADLGARRVVDVGAGVGKVCLVGALVSDLRFVGLERRKTLVDVARQLAVRLGVAERVKFVKGGLGAIDLADYDGAYVYNPFAEHLSPPDERIDSTVRFGPRRFAKDLEALETMLAEAPVGFRLVTYYRMGGRIDDTYELVHVEQLANARLRLWEKRHATSRDHVWIETDDEHGAVLVKRAATWIPD
ncbi:MAG: hypothetical protein U0230_15705 [Polyangiales bacterium]